MKTLQLEEQEIGYLVQVLAQRPYIEVVQLLGKIDVQLKLQSIPPMAPPNEDKKA